MDSFSVGLPAQADESEVWFRRKVYLKTAIFIVCFVGVGLSLILLFP